MVQKGYGRCCVSSFLFITLASYPHSITSLINPTQVWGHELQYFNEPQMTSRHSGAPLGLLMALAWGVSNCPPCQHVLLISRSCGLLDLAFWELPCLNVAWLSWADMQKCPFGLHETIIDQGEGSAQVHLGNQWVYGDFYRSMVTSRTAESLESPTLAWLSTQESCETEVPHAAQPALHLLYPLVSLEHVTLGHNLR